MKHLAMSGLILMLVTMGWTHVSDGEQPPAPRGELRIVDNDPRNFIHIAWNVFEHLMTLDRHGKLVPRLATSWKWRDERTLDVTLRRGVTFHNGEVFNADIVQLNFIQIIGTPQTHMLGNFLNFKPGSHLEIVDPYTVRFVFPEPDGGALAKLAGMHISNRQFYRDHGWQEKEW